MSTTKRIPIDCWNCQRRYTLLREFDGEPVLNVACPYCRKAGEIDLAPYQPTVKDHHRRQGSVALHSGNAESARRLAQPATGR